MFLIGSLVIFNFIMLRQLKDSLLIGRMGAKAIPIAKLYMFPMSVLMMFLHSKLSSYFDGRKMFILFTAVFGVLFLIYALFLLEIDSKLLGFVFYISSEMWSTVVFGTCMWAFFNDICSVDEAKRFYILVSGAQVGSLIASGSAKWFVSTFGESYFKVALLNVVVFCFLIIFVVYFYGSVLVNKMEVLGEKPLEKRVKEEKKTYKGIFNGILLIAKSRYLFLILFITLSYNFTIIVTEYIWKSNLAVVYPSKAQIFVVTGNVTFYATTIASLISIFLAGGVMRYIGLTTALAMFPAVFGISTTFYFFLYMVPLGGSVQWIITKISKYALADPAKQMLYIPCSKEEKYQAKSVIDIVGARGGKALASLFNHIFLGCMVNFKEMAYFSYPIIIVITVLWFLAAISVGLTFKKLSGEKNGTQIN